MRQLQMSAWLAVLVSGVAFVSACGDEDSDNPASNAGKGGSAGSSAGTAGRSGGSSGSGGTDNEGGTGNDGSGGSGNNGSGGTDSEGGTGNDGSGGTDSEGGTGNDGSGGTGNNTSGGSAGGGGEPNPPDACVIYDADQSLRGAPVDIPAVDGAVVTDGDSDGDDNALTLTSDKTWRINGRIFVGDGKTLNIEPCTLIVGSPKPNAGSLFIARGGKINAVGTADEPIVFSSEDYEFHANSPWGGIALLGKAPIGAVNGSADVDRPFEGLDRTNDPYALYGGTEPEDSSGSMRYVRIEYGGDIISTNKEINGLSFGGVGSGTEIDHIMVKRQMDDCYEFFGGTVSAHHLICDNTGDDMFDTDEKYTGYLQFLFGRVTTAGTSTDPSGFEWDGNQAWSGSSGTSWDDGGTPHASNATLCGLGVAGPTSYGAVLRRDFNQAGGSMVANTIITGWHIGVDPRNRFGTNAAPIFSWTNGLFFKNFTNNIAPASESSDNDGAFDELAWIIDPAYGNGNGNADLSEPASQGTTPDGFDCFGADDVPTPFPPAKIQGAAAGDGFPDADADFVGAFEDADDNWMTGLWVDWSAGN